MPLTWISNTWFREGGRRNLAICRIVAFSSILFGLYLPLSAELGERLSMVAVGQGLPYARGIFVMHPHVPPFWLLQGLSLLAGISTVMAIAGVFTRVAMPVSVFAQLFVSWFVISFQPSVSHQGTPYLLVGLAMMFGPAGDELSFDAWRARGAARTLPAAGYWWPVLLAQAAVTLLFGNAFFWKMKVSGLAWAFSDNLRNAVIRTNWWYYHATPQGLLRWIVERDWAFHWVAVGNLICQSTLLLACFLTHRPRWRAVLGVLFVSETIGLGVFMGIWNWWWLPLSIFFFDVEALSQSRNVAGQDRKPLPGHGRQLAAGVFITGYLALFCSVAFSSAKGQRFYPFNSYPMYCTVLARKPYSEHLPYDEVVRKFQCRPGNGDSVQILRARSYLMRAPVQSAEQMDYVLTEAERLHPRKNGDVIEVFATPIWIPAYPAPPEAQTIASYCVAMIAADGQRYGAAARVVKVPRSRPVVEVSTLGYAGAAIRLLYYPLPIMNPKLEPQPLPGRFAGEGSSRFEPGPLPPGSYQTLIEVTNPNSGERLTYYGPVWTEPKPALRQKSSPH